MLTPLSQVKPTKSSWLVEDIIQAGRLNLLEGRPSAGKTSMCGLLASRHSNFGHGFTIRLPFPDRGILEPRRRSFYKVLWLTQEEGESQILSRLQKYEADLDAILIPRSADGGLDRIVLPSQFDYLKSLIMEHEIGMVVIDPIQAIVEGNVNLETDVRSALEPLLSFIASTKCTVVATRHFKKNCSGSPRIFWGTNSNAFASLARCMVHFEKKDLAGRSLGEQKDKRLTLMRVIKLSEGSADSEYDAWLENGLIVSLGESIIQDDGQRTEDDEATASAMADAMVILDRCRTDWVAFNVLEAEAREAGVSIRTLQTAKKRMGIVSRRIVLGGRPRWEWGDATLPSNKKSADGVAGPWDSANQEKPNA